MYSIIIIIWPSILIDKFVSGVCCTIGHMPKRCCSIVNLKSLGALRSLKYLLDLLKSLQVFLLVKKDFHYCHWLCTIKHLVAVWWFQLLVLWEVIDSFPLLGWNTLTEVHQPLENILSCCVWCCYWPNLLENLKSTEAALLFQKD